jgi:hypothetical protein
MHPYKVEKSYDEAINSLKEVNEKLFYGDLKDKLNEHTQELGERYKESIQKVESMNRTVQNLPILVEGEVTKALTLLQLGVDDAVQSQLDRMEETFTREVNHFITLQENFQYIFAEMEKLRATQFEEWQQFLEQQKSFYEMSHQQQMVERAKYFQQYQSKLGEQSSSLMSQLNDLGSQLKEAEGSLSKLQNEGLEQLVKKAEEDTNVLRGNVLETYDKTKTKLESLESDITDKIEVVSKNIRNELQEKEEEQTIFIKNHMVDFQENLDTVKKSFEEQMLAFRLAASTQAQEQASLTNEHFKELTEMVKNDRHQNDKKHKTALYIMIGLAIGEAVIIGTQWLM